jgi:chromate transporter
VNFPVLELQWLDWAALFLQYMMLSLISIGGVIATVPEMHRFLVEQHHWLAETQFNGSIAIAQAAPGPNVLFVALLGWNVGMNAGGYAWAVLGMAVTLVGVLLPSTTLTYLVASWGHRNRELRAVRAFKQGMAPIVLALLIATGWILAGAHREVQEGWGLWLLSAVTVVAVTRTRLHILWLLGAGALVGALGLI